MAKREYKRGRRIGGDEKAGSETNLRAGRQCPKLWKAGPGRERYVDRRDDRIQTVRHRGGNEVAAACRAGRECRTRARTAEAAQRKGSRRRVTGADGGLDRGAARALFRGEAHVRQ